MSLSAEALVALSRFRAAVPPHRRSEYLPGEAVDFARWLRECPTSSDADGDDDAERLTHLGCLIEDWLAECPLDPDERTVNDYEHSLLAAVIEAP